MAVEAKNFSGCHTRGAASSFGVSGIGTVCSPKTSTLLRATRTRPRSPLADLDPHHAGLCAAAEATLHCNNTSVPENAAHNQHTSWCWHRQQHIVPGKPTTAVNTQPRSPPGKNADGRMRVGRSIRWSSSVDDGLRAYGRLRNRDIPVLIRRTMHLDGHAGRCPMQSLAPAAIRNVKCSRKSQIVVGDAMWKEGMEGMRIRD